MQTQGGMRMQIKTVKVPYSYTGTFEASRLAPDDFDDDDGFEDDDGDDDE